MKGESRDIRDCVPELREKDPLIRADFTAKYPDLILKPICTLRSLEYQNQLWLKGRVIPGKKVTNISGIYPNVGKHNPIPNQPHSRAIDYGIFRGKEYLPLAPEYDYIGELAKKYNLRWGGDWNNDGIANESLVDKPHVETWND